MSSVINFPFDTPSNYTYDTDKIEVTGGVAKLKFQNNTGQTFNQPFTSSSGFVYNSSLAEFSAGKVQQKDTRPAGSTFYASYNTNEHGNWGQTTLTGVLTSATVSGGFLDCTGNTIDKYCKYSGYNNFNFTQTGAIRFKYKPNYSGAPTGSSHYLFQLKNSSNNNNMINMTHLLSSGTLIMRIYDSTGAYIVAHSMGAWLPTAGTTYEFEVNIDLTTGAHRTFINGVQHDGTNTITGTRASDNIQLWAGGIVGYPSDGSIGDILIFNTVQHTTNYTPDWSGIYETIYVTNKVEMPQFLYPDSGNIQAFTNFATTESGSPKYVMNDLYYSGGWVSSNGSYAQANTKATVLANIATLPASDTLDIDIVYDNSATQSYVDDLTTTYTGQIYPVDNPTIAINTAFTASEILTFSETSTITGSDNIQYILPVNGVNKYITGGSVATSDGTYTQSNTAADVNTYAVEYLSTRSSVKLTAFLHSDDGSTTPELDLNSITYDSSLSDPSVSTLIEIEGYIYTPTGVKASTTLFIRPYNRGFINNDVFVIYEYETLGTTNADGWFESDVYINPTSKYYDIKIGIESYKVDLTGLSGTIDFSTLTLEYIEEEE